MVEGGSMENTLYDDEHLIITNLFYTPQRGDIVVCQDRATGLENPIIKRVIAIEGDTIEIRNNQVIVNGEIIEEKYVFLSDKKYIYDDFPEQTVPENTVFVMGDHRDASTDSRKFNSTFVREDAILGKVIFRFFPFNSFGTVE